jgi:hypothetical protein
MRYCDHRWVAEIVTFLGSVRGSTHTDRSNHQDCHGGGQNPRLECFQMGVLLQGYGAAKSDAGDSNAEEKRQVSVVPDLEKDSLSFAAGSIPVNPQAITWDLQTS